MKVTSHMHGRPYDPIRGLREEKAELEAKARAAREYISDRDEWPMETCWFCGRRPADPTSAFGEGISLKGTKWDDPLAARPGVRVSKMPVVTVTAHFPRCATCRRNHLTQLRLSWASLALPVLGVLVALPFVPQTDTAVALVLSGAGGLAGTCLLAKLLIRRRYIHSESKAFGGFPGMTHLRAQGWYSEYHRG
jgi:hypothetical protein